MMAVLLELIALLKLRFLQNDVIKAKNRKPIIWTYTGYIVS